MPTSPPALQFPCFLWNIPALGGTASPTTLPGHSRPSPLHTQKGFSYRETPKLSQVLTAGY